MEQEGTTMAMFETVSKPLEAPPPVLSVLTGFASEFTLAVETSARSMMTSTCAIHDRTREDPEDAGERQASEAGEDRPVLPVGGMRLYEEPVLDEETHAASLC